MAEIKTPLEKAEELLFAHLNETQKKHYQEYGVIRVLGSNGDLFYLATDDAMIKNCIARVYSVHNSVKQTYCVDFPALLAPEKILVMKVVVEQCCELLTGYVDVSEGNI